MKNVLLASVFISGLIIVVALVNAFFNELDKMPNWPFIVFGVILIIYLAYKEHK